MKFQDLVNELDEQNADVRAASTTADEDQQRVLQMSKSLEAMYERLERGNKDADAIWHAYETKVNMMGGVYRVDRRSVAVGDGLLSIWVNVVTGKVQVKGHADDIGKLTALCRKANEVAKAARELCIEAEAEEELVDRPSHQEVIDAVTEYRYAFRAAVKKLIDADAMVVKSYTNELIIRRNEHGMGITTTSVVTQRQTDRMGWKRFWTLLERGGFKFDGFEFNRRMMTEGAWANLRVRV